MASTQVLINLFNFIKKEGNGDLNPDHYQLVLDIKGLGVSVEIKYIHSEPDKRKELGTISL